MRKIFRHGFTSYLLMICFSISCFILIYGVNVFYNVRNENLSIKRYKEQLKNDYDISNLEDGNTDYEKVAETLINSAQEIDSCNVSFVSKLYINNRIDWYETNIIVKTNEPIKLDISKK